MTDSPPINFPKEFLASSETKDSLTFYLADKVLQLKIPIVSVTCQQVQTNVKDQLPLTKVSTHEEADTLMILHAAELSGKQKNVHIMMQDTDVMVLALCRFPHLGPPSTMIIGTGEHHRKIPLKPVYDTLGH